MYALLDWWSCKTGMHFIMSHNIITSTHNIMIPVFLFFKSLALRVTGWGLRKHIIFVVKNRKKPYVCYVLIWQQNECSITYENIYTYFVNITVLTGKITTLINLLSQAFTLCSFSSLGHHLKGAESRRQKPPLSSFLCSLDHLETGQAFERVN